jgi:branched-chain amino acid transport system permease protein
MLYALLSIGLSLVFGVTRIVNLAHGEIIMIGMYITWLLYTLGVNPFLAVLICVVVGFLIGVSIHKLVLSRAEGQENLSLITTYGMSIFLINLFLIVFSGDLRTVPYFVGSYSLTSEITIPISRLYAAVLSSVCTGILIVLIYKTRFGKAWRASVDDRVGASLCGVNTKRMDMFSIALGFVFGAIGGSVASLIYAFTPTIGGSFILICFISTVIGGMGDIIGTLIGSLLIGIIDVYASFMVEPVMSKVILFLILIITFMIRPQGLRGR